MSRAIPIIRHARRPGSIIIESGRYLRITETGVEPYTPPSHPAQTGRALHCVGAGERSHHVERELIV